MRSVFHALENHMTTLHKGLRILAGDEGGASLAEYGLLLALIALACVAVISLLGGSVSGMLNLMANTI